MIGLEMVGTSNRWIWTLAALLLAFSCTREMPMDEPAASLGEYDPVVRFGLETYMGPDNTTKTTYAGDTETLLLNSVRYERINWNVDPSPTDMSTKADTVRVLSEQDFTKNNKKKVDYIPTKINGITNKTGLVTSEADATPISGEADNLYWNVSDKPRYFYAVYPSPEGRKVTYKPVVTISDPNTLEHSVTVTGAIPREQKYASVNKDVMGKVVEYLPNMADAYMYAAAKVPVANAGYKKVPLKFKPLFSAVKLIITASDAGAEDYRLKKVELRTDLFYNDLHQGNPTRVNAPTEGTALNGAFTAKFTAETTDDKTPAYTGNFTITSQPTLASIADTTFKRLTIRIPEVDRVWLGDDTVKVTFLALPIDHTVMTVVYTFEKNDGSGNPVLDDETGEPVEVTRYLSLQQKTNSNTHNEFTGRDWYTLKAANKLYVRSDVPEILYVFEVETQGNFPRTWRPGSLSPPGKSGFFEAKDFYSVASYRDSSGVLQPLRWKVTGYKPEGATDFTSTKPDVASWFNMRGDDPWAKHPPFDVNDSKHPGYPYTDEGYSFDPWEIVQGEGTKMKDPVKDKNGFTIGYRNFNPYSAQFYDAGAPNNDTGYPRKWDWENPVAYNYMDAGGSFVHPHPYTPTPGFTGEAGEAYAFDLSSHDIYGNLYPGFKNGDLGNTANCYIVSAPGWYRIPAVYGCAIKDGADNPSSYTGAGGTNILKEFLDYQDQPITSPWIPYTLTSADVVWDDANHMVAPDATRITRAPRTAFCKKLNGRQYVYFYVDDIAQGNAVVAAKDASGIVVWSWHIWAVTKPTDYLKLVPLQSNALTVNQHPSGGASNPYQSIYKENGLGTNYFWKDKDLGHNGKEDGYITINPRYCDVEFTQYFKGKVVTKIVRRFLQSGVKDDADIAPMYQWGRKDPVRSDQNPPTVEIPAVWHSPAVVQNLGNTIKHPEIMYLGPNEELPQGIRYDNLWNTNVNKRITTSYSNGTTTGSLDRYVEKTIYDPSPVGYCLPNMYAFTGLNPWGPINQIMVPNRPENLTDVEDSRLVDAKNGIALNPRTTFSQGYIDFYYEYKESETYRREKTSEKTIRFYVTGRRNGNSGAGTRDRFTGNSGSDQGAFYWTSEPAMWGNGLFGRCLWFLGPDAKKNQGYRWFMAPVAGSDVTSGGDPKWQRTHGLTVRPMLQPSGSTSPGAGKFTGSNMENPVSSNPF